MANRAPTTKELNVADVSSHWTGGKNVIWRLTHEPTGFVVEGSTQIPEERFSKKRLRIAEEKLRAELLEELGKRVARDVKTAGMAGDG
ncbi:MAG TPA: hypothetical protein VFE58_02445 [Tepidisphaeraceae bacterium]|jgi:hypothetical protein|nr:hypothetical protein [Tepidisphaeraceae bacterium]